MAHVTVDGLLGTSWKTAADLTSFNSALHLIIFTRNLRDINVYFLFFYFFLLTSTNSGRRGISKKKLTIFSMICSNMSASWGICSRSTIFSLNLLDRSMVHIQAIVCHFSWRNSAL